MPLPDVPRPLVTFVEGPLPRPLLLHLPGDGPRVHLVEGLGHLGPPRHRPAPDQWPLEIETFCNFDKVLKKVQLYLSFKISVGGCFPEYLDT